MLNFTEVQYLGLFGIIALAYTATVMVPGPDFACIMRNTLSDSRRSGIFAALGVTTGMCFHLSYSIPSAIWLHSQPILMFIAKIAGGLYLCYLGCSSVIKAKAKKITNLTSHQQQKKPNLTRLKAFRSGFFTNAMNPMVMIFFVGLFTTQIEHTTPNSILALLGTEVLLIALTWFVLVAVFFSQPAVHSIFLRLGHWVERVTGGVLIALGFRVALQVIPY